MMKIPLAAFAAALLGLAAVPMIASAGDLNRAAVLPQTDCLKLDKANTLATSDLRKPVVPTINNMARVMTVTPVT